MKWMLVISFMTAQGWQSAGQLGKDGWAPYEYPTRELCMKARLQFDLNIRTDKVKAECVPDL